MRLVLCLSAVDTATNEVDEAKCKRTEFCSKFIYLGSDGNPLPTTNPNETRISEGDIEV